VFKAHKWKPPYRELYAWAATTRSAHPQRAAVMQPISEIDAAATVSD